MVMPYFEFKGIKSSEYDILINKLPLIHSVSNEVEYISVPGRDGYLTIDTERKEKIEKTVTFTIYPDAHLPQIKKWLRGAGRVTFSNEPDVYFEARVESVREYEGAGYERMAEIEFICQPHAYLLANGSATVRTKHTKLQNREEPSNPYMKVFGSGRVSLYVNEKKMTFIINDYVEIDSELQVSYRGNDPVKMTGGFPKFKEGENNIYWDGTITRIEVEPRWRR